MSQSSKVKELALPAGSKVQVGDKKYRLAADAVVLGRTEPIWFDGPFLAGSDGAADEIAAESGEGNIGDQKDRLPIGWVRAKST